MSSHLAAAALVVMLGGFGLAVFAQYVGLA